MGPSHHWWQNSPSPTPALWSPNHLLAPPLPRIPEAALLLSVFMSMAPQDPPKWVIVFVSSLSQPRVPKCNCAVAYDRMTFLMQHLGLGT